MAKDVTGSGFGIGGLSDDLDVSLGFEHHADSLADELMIVGQYDRDLGAIPIRSGVSGHARTIAIEAPSFAQRNS